MGNYIKNSYKDNLLCRYSYGTCIWMEATPPYIVHVYSFPIPYTDDVSDPRFRMVALWGF